MHYAHLPATSDSDFTQKAVEWISHRMKRAIADRGQCIIGLSGGSTPRPVYSALGREDIDWSKVFVHLVDERYVPATHQDSNQRLVRDTLLMHAQIPDAQLIFPDTSLPIEECVQDYEGQVHALWAENLTDVMVLGMGDDGHIASLFPPLLPHMMDETRIVIHTTTDRFVIHDRITLTLNPIASAHSTVFLLTGADKKRTWTEMLASTEDETRWPVKELFQEDEADVAAITLW
ncbi:6-phosphogluconolactonase [Candidatus Peribacteria bacterium]|nr:MAG: 6-phosphogluconolactonase [Candidatus Peribacteria bacterium]